MKTTLKQRCIAAVCLVAIAPMGCRPKAPPTTQPAAPMYTGALTYDVVVPANYIEHHSTDGRVSIKSPAGWKKVPGGNSTIVLKLVGDDHLTNLSVIEKDQPETRDIQMLADMSTKQLAAEIPHFALQITEYVWIAGIDSACMTFTGDCAGVHYHWKQVILLGSTHVYIVTFTSPETHYENHLATTDLMLASIKIAGETVK